MNLEGGCSCGAIRYKLTNSPLIVHACHCRDCQRVTGSGFVINIWIEKKFVEASAFALAGALLTFFGFMHGESVGIAVTPVVAIAYVIVAVFLFGLSLAPASSLDKTAPHEAIPEGVPAE